MTPLFLGIAALITLLSLALLLRPLLLRGTQQAASRQALNAAIYADQLTELRSDRASGNLAENDFEQASNELQRRLLDDAQTVDVAPLAARPPWQMLLLLAVALPTAAMVTYVWVGHPRAQQPSAVAHDDSVAQVEQMVAALAARLEQNPDDLKGWGMLARSYKVMRRFDEAEQAFGRLGQALYADPTLLAEYADLLAVKSEGNLEGKPRQLVEKALQLDPNHMMALSLAGTAAYNRNDYAAALRYWEHLYTLLPPESEDAQALSATLIEIRTKAGIKASPGTAAKAAAAPGKSVSGEVSLSPSLQAKVQADDTLFIFARPASGGRMPLAVLRARVADLPMKFTLDDKLALTPQSAISTASEVKVEALISKSGTANPSAGDPYGESVAVKVGAAGVRLVIDKTTP